MYDLKKAKEIYNELINGRIINKHKLDNAANLIEDELFIEIMQNEEDYRKQYEMSGYELVQTGTFVFIRKEDSDYESLKTDITMKAYILLLLMAKYLTEHNYRLSKLTDADGGIGTKDIEVIEAMPDTAEILHKAGFKGDLAQNVKNILVKRNILLEKASEQAFILSDAGREFFNELVNSGIANINFKNE